MSDDFDGLIEGVAELLGELVSLVDFSSSSSSAVAGAALAPAAEVPHPDYPAGCEFRVKENDWWDGIDTGDVLTVVKSSMHDVLFELPNGRKLNVPMGVIDDFERIPDAAKGSSEE
uniref:Uncharacterized protein n=1 Tax=Pseudomonas phage HRDY3 TaxID=3236930 RepID=A0AB39CEH6_9VIRU